MRLFGFTIAREKAAPVPARAVPDDRGWMTVWSGGGSTPWQLTQGFQLDLPPPSNRALLSNPAVFACQTLIANDIAKLQCGFVRRADDGVESPLRITNLSGLLRKPNHIQVWGQFIASWMHSKLSHGNAYVLIQRGPGGTGGLHVLDPDRVTPLIAEDGSVYYRLSTDELSGVDEEVVVPASEIMHDRFNTFFHPLVGLSPLFACAMAAAQGNEIQQESRRFFRNGARPSGILVAPQTIGNELAKQYKEQWETNYGGANAGRTAVLGNGLTYTPINRESAVDSELIGQLKLGAEQICSAYHVPAYKVGVGAMPTYQNAEILNQIYYDDCLQVHIEAIEALLDEGLSLKADIHAQFDLDGLLRMDSRTKIEALGKGVGAGFIAPNEARRRIGLGPVDGGDDCYLQMQNFSIAALAKRDALPNPFATSAPSAPPATDPPAPKKAAVSIVRRHEGGTPFYQVKGTPETSTWMTDFGLREYLAERGSIQFDVEDEG